MHTPMLITALMCGMLGILRRDDKPGSPGANPHRIALANQGKEKKTALDALLAKTELTAEEEKQIGTLTSELSDINARLKTFIDADEASKTAVYDRGGGELDLKGIGGDRDAKITRGGEVGADIVQLMMNGTMVKVGTEGFCLSPKVAERIQTDEYMSAYIDYLRKGTSASRDSMQTLDETKSWQEGNDALGGYFVPPQFVMEIIRPDPQQSGLLDIVTTVPVSGSDTLQAPKFNYTTDDIYSSPYRKRRTGETEAPTSETDPSVGLASISVFEGSLEVPMTRSFLQDAPYAEQFVNTLLRESFRLGTEYELALGAGINTPKGILVGAGTANHPDTVNIANPVTGDGLIDLFYTLPSQYRANAKLVLNDTNVYRTWAKIKDTDGNYIFGLFKNTDGGMATPRGEVFLGKPMVFNPFYTDGAAAAKVASWGDHAKAYWYALRMGMTIEVQMLPRDAFAYIVLRFRDGGKIVQSRALKIAVQS